MKESRKLVLNFVTGECKRGESFVSVCPIGRGTVTTIRLVAVHRGLV